MLCRLAQVCKNYGKKVGGGQRVVVGVATLSMSADTSILAFTLPLIWATTYQRGRVPWAGEDPPGMEGACPVRVVRWDQTQRVWVLTAGGLSVCPLRGATSISAAAEQQAGDRAHQITWLAKGVGLGYA